LSLGLFLLSFQGIGFVTEIARYATVIASAAQYVRTAQSRLGEVMRIGNDTKAGQERVAVSAGIDVDVAPGELVVLTGAEGSDKPEAALLNCNLDGPIRCVREESFLFATTLRENL